MSFSDDDLDKNFRGVVSKWFPGRHFGFVVADNGQEVFLGKHEWPESTDPKINSVVEFTLGKNGKGWAAVKCTIESVPAVDLSSNFASSKGVQKSKKVMDKALNMKLQSLKKVLRKEENVTEGQKLVINREDVARFGHFAPKARGISFFDPQELSTIVQALDFYRAMESWTNAPTNVIACRDLSVIFVSEMNEYKQSINEKIFSGLSVSATSSDRAKELWHVISSQPRSVNVVMDLLCDANNTRTSKEDELFRVCFDTCIHHHSDMNWLSKAAWILLHASRSQTICPENFLPAFILVNWYLLQVANLPFPLAFNFDAMTEETNDQLREALTGGDEIMLAIWICKEMCAQWVDFDQLVQQSVAENSAILGMSTSVHGALKAGTYETESDEEERKVAEGEEENAVNQSTTTTSSARDEEERIHEVIVSHRRSQRADFCFICMDDNIRPTISLLCCGQPCHIKCMEKWYGSKPNLVGREKCPQCTQEIPEPMLVTHAANSNPNSGNGNNPSVTGNNHSLHGNVPHYHQIQPTVLVPPHQQAAYYAYQRRPHTDAHPSVHVPVHSQPNYAAAAIRSEQVWQDLVRQSHQQRRLPTTTMPGTAPSSSSSSSSSSRRIALLNTGIVPGMGAVEAPLPPGHPPSASTATNPATTYTVTGPHPVFPYGYPIPVVTTSAANTATSASLSSVPSSATSVLASTRPYYPHSGQLVYSSGEVVSFNGNNGMMQRSRSVPSSSYARAPSTTSASTAVPPANHHVNHPSINDHAHLPLIFQSLFPTQQPPSQHAYSATAAAHQQRPHSNSDDRFEMLFAHHNAMIHQPSTSAAAAVAAAATAEVVASSTITEPLVIPGIMSQLPPPAVSAAVPAAPVATAAPTAAVGTSATTSHNNNSNSNYNNISVSHLDRFLASFPPSAPATVNTAAATALPTADAPSSSPSHLTNSANSATGSNLNHLVTSSSRTASDSDAMMVIPLTPHTEEIFRPLRSGEAAPSIQPSLHSVPQSPLCQHCGLALRAVECTNFHCGRCCQRVGALNCLRHHRAHVTPAGVILVAEEEVSPANALVNVAERDSSDDVVRNNNEEEEEEEEDIYDLRPDPELAALPPRGHMLTAVNNDPIVPETQELFQFPRLVAESDTDSGTREDEQEEKDESEN